MVFDHLYMDCAANAMFMLDALNGLFKKAGPAWFANKNDPKSLKLPMVHVYGYTRGDTAEE